jgi:hypothetical protein
MGISAACAWIWLGFEELYYRPVAQTEWQALRQTVNVEKGELAPSWAVKVPIAGGQVGLHHPGLRLGLSEDPGCQALFGYVLGRLIAQIGDFPIVFAPPVQLEGLVAIARRIKKHPPRALVLDSVLFAGEESAQTGMLGAQDNAYVLDWSRPQQRVSRRFSAKCIPRGEPAKPVLMTVEAYVKGRGEVLSTCTDRPGIIPINAHLKVPLQPRHGRLPVGLGLVWAWGTGPMLWQWALRPRELPRWTSTDSVQDRMIWQLELAAPWSYRITAAEESIEGNLTPPVLYASLGSK